ncbi:hypothetical protein D9613_012346 [Agrocybe pediades]|uniref:Fungal-type protein kinase domain-containing protein n=1 Tax=Agrocybe pediades TaxID=84607 RepID=A0A8H4VHP4_9AGAR|nr:hypothetical protein D9613_012346 [Agrocybe pediades]
MAVEFPRSDNDAVLTDFRTGTRAFQSINILNSYHSSRRIAEHVPHDYLDDLESFLYVFRWMVEGYSGPGKEVKPRPPYLLEWMHESPALAKACKASSYFLPPCHLVQDYFGEPAQTLVDKYSKFLKDKISAKLHYYAGLDSDSEDDIQSLPDLQEAADQDYAAVIKMFDDAIDEMKQLPDFQDPSKDPADGEQLVKPKEPTTPPPNSNAQVSGTKRSRRSSDEEEERRVSKQRRTSVFSSSSAWAASASF